MANGSTSNRATMNVSLAPELEQFVQSRIASGRYRTSSETIRKKLRLLKELRTQLAWLRRH